MTTFYLLKPKTAKGETIVNKHGVRFFLLSRGYKENRPIMYITLQSVVSGNIFTTPFENNADFEIVHAWQLTLFVLHFVYE